MCARSMYLIVKTIMVVAKATKSKKLAKLYVEWLTKAQRAEFEEFRSNK